MYWFRYKYIYRNLHFIYYFYNIQVVKKEFIPSEVHGDAKAARAAEESERSRRLKDPMEAIHAEEAAAISHRVYFYVFFY